MDNGPELVSLALAQWAEEHGVMLEFIKPGKPTQNAFIERFNRTYRTEILDFYLFRTLNEAREITERWLMNITTSGLWLRMIFPFVQYRCKVEFSALLFRPKRGHSL
jgi:transposase InsO family protein